MEAFFKRLSALSATTILLILTSIFVVLFLYAKPAIEAYGLKFLVDPRWDVVITPQKATSAPKKTENLGGVNVDNEDDIPTVNIPKQNQKVNVQEDDLGDIPTPASTTKVNTQDDDLAGVNVQEEDLGISAPTQNTQPQKQKVIYGGLVPIVGTILSTALAMIFAVPIAMGIAIFLSEIAPPFISKPVGIAIELLAAIPSIIYGMWGLFYFGPFISHIFGGGSVSLLVAGLVLGIMIIPFMASLTRDSMKTTPDVLKESAYAMGATKFEVIKDVIFPYAKKGIIGSMILALGRALGETMAVAFVIGGVFTFPHKLTDPTVSIPVVLANNFAESSGMSLSALFYLALILFVISFIVISFAKFYFLRDKK
ncbi:phosphate ABC transporter permease subunit PstC [Caminibacter pacificus]|uniref:Phosphate transport system permease protein n=1 Tax=Caminibacter pacificus TaxID=1424653 RepID=A0AAJ4RCV9_9BACT|nr:phosphate ABC transporter permease subunit PstC [Caminibacter pacificus]NPA87497.1 phosphate ABC transporter permease subunit PstC [Campylobacterota bacterium]QCI27884.1 phosphate ABC transporter permease subunit PstC [Caminibacter pacificus]ROR39938.1 phosphate transport system permease protein [Caminibacter pacificus]